MKALTCTSRSEGNKKTGLHTRQSCRQCLLELQHALRRFTVTARSSGVFIFGVNNGRERGYDAKAREGVDEKYFYSFFAFFFFFGSSVLSCSLITSSDS